MDASCGRGHLSRSLKSIGYEVEATEISQWLIDHELTDLNVSNLPYDQLDLLPSNSYDAVITNDVLEHLLDKRDVLFAISNLINLSKEFVLISVGTKRRTSEKYPVALGMDIGSLHTFVPGMKWWKSELNSRLDLVLEHEFPANYMFFGKVKS